MLDVKELQRFEREFYSRREKGYPFSIPFSGVLRYGQMACNLFKLPKDIENKIYYETNEEVCKKILWEYVTK